MFTVYLNALFSCEYDLRFFSISFLFYFVFAISYLTVKRALTRCPLSLSCVSRLIFVAL